MSDRFTKLDDGWYRDSETGLEWSPTAALDMNHAEAIAWCEAQGGRLPKRVELLSIVDDTKHLPCTDIPDTRSFGYWSASTYAPDQRDAWGVYFNAGWVGAVGKESSNCVRAVRDCEPQS